MQDAFMLQMLLPSAKRIEPVALCSGQRCPPAPPAMGTGTPATIQPDRHSSLAGHGVRMRRAGAGKLQRRCLTGARTSCVLQEMPASVQRRRCMSPCAYIANPVPVTSAVICREASTSIAHALAQNISAEWLPMQVQRMLHDIGATDDLWAESPSTQAFVCTHQRKAIGLLAVRTLPKGTKARPAPRSFFAAPPLPKCGSQMGTDAGATPKRPAKQLTLRQLLKRRKSGLAASKDADPTAADNSPALAGVATRGCSAPAELRTDPGLPCTADAHAQLFDEAGVATRGHGAPRAMPAMSRPSSHHVCDLLQRNCPPTRTWDTAPQQAAATKCCTSVAAMPQPPLVDVSNAAQQRRLTNAARSHQQVSRQGHVKPAGQRRQRRGKVAQMLATQLTQPSRKAAHCAARQRGSAPAQLEQNTPADEFDPAKPQLNQRNAADGTQATCSRSQHAAADDPAEQSQPIVSCCQCQSNALQRPDHLAGAHVAPGHADGSCTAVMRASGASNDAAAEQHVAKGRHMSLGQALPLHEEAPGHLKYDTVAFSTALNVRAAQPALEVTAVWVSQRWRRRGVARALLDCACAHSVLGRAVHVKDVAWAMWLTDASHLAEACCGSRSHVLALESCNA